MILPLGLRLDNMRSSDDHESLCIMEALSRSQNSAETGRDGPKLEDFLGGKSLGGQYCTDRDHHHSHQHQQLEGLLALNHLNHCYESHEQQQQQQLQENNLLAQSRSHLHAQNLLQSALDQQRSDCSLQMPQSSSAGLKSWLHHQADTDSKAAAALGPQTRHSSSSFSAALASWQPLSLSMSAGSSHVTDHAVDQQLVLPGHHLAESSPQAAAVPEPRKRGAGRMGAGAASKDGGPSPRKSIDTFGQRTSVYRGVTRHRWTGRYEAHLWDNSCRKEGQTRKGRQGGYDKEDKAARAYDLAALKYWGPSTTINFPLSTYEAELEVMKNMTRQEYVASLRRKSSGFSRGASVYRGVTRHHQHGRWQARIGRVAGNKDLYLGTYSTQEEAAEAYDIAAIKFRGVNAVTNFDMSKYDPQKIHAAAVNGQHGQDLSFKCKPTDQKLITELSNTPSSDGPAMQQPAGYDHVGTAASDQQLQTSETRAISNSGLTYNQGSHDRSESVLTKFFSFLADMNMESPRNSVGESEEASSKNSTFDRVLSGDLSQSLLFSASATTTSTVKMNPGYDSNPLSTWIGISNPLTLPTLTGRPANLSQMGSSPIFAHSWTE
ncbi:unnamed protein product [Sphagnum troendelagicum]|uniref:AP2/ERF domain-containing protein n=1 Tax=Sphagnum troendelagicum TaxID=128251 RepID=A0ABP0TBE2_9BRYO